MKRLLLIAACMAIAGCASRFGHRNEQTLILVRTVPPHLPYFVLERSEADKVLVDGAVGLQIRRPEEFQQLLNRQLQGLVSDSSALTYSVGSYIIAVRCSAGFRFQQMDARPAIANEVKLSCT